MMLHPFSNRLINESSPYLLQHAHNPVDWYPWGDEALQKAKAENKIMLVSIGYAACHWCHVMERESFENETVAALMNEHFINIKIDREERPDLDHIYMDAVQAMTGSGGWPLNVFLTPDAKPFYGGTYFPPVKAHSRSSWTDVLNGVYTAWKQRGAEISSQAEELTAHLQRSNEFVKPAAKGADGKEAALFTKEDSDLIFDNIMKSADREWGGFGKAPKFPQTFTIQYLLQYHYFTKNKEALEQACLSIDRMLEGGIYDHVGGGLARYSTDNEWLAPHFEKMLYDNALLLNILADVYLITRNKYYEQAIRKTIGFIERELLDADGGFYAALDADSEGEEGKYYVWRKKEIDELLGDDSNLFCDFFDVSETGNWSEGPSDDAGKNILRILKKQEQFAADAGIDAGLFAQKIEACLQKLLVKRNSRVRPLLDDKIILGWNALMITALCKAAAALGDRAYRDLAEKNFSFLLDKFSNPGVPTQFQHTYKNKEAKYPAFLDDYAFLVQACIHLQEISSDPGYLLHAKRFAIHVIENFSDDSTGYFFFTNRSQTDVIIRKKEVYDGAIPSGNSIMAENLFYLAGVFDKPEWQKRASELLSPLQNAVVRYPGSFAIWASLFLKQLYGTCELVITGNGADLFRDDLARIYLPNKIIQCSTLPDKRFPLLAGKKFDERPQAYLCRNYSCQPPVKSKDELVALIAKTSLK